MNSMIFISIIKGIGCTIVALLCLALALKLFVKSLRFDDEVSFLLMVSVGVSIILMSIYCFVDNSEEKVRYAQSQINNALSQAQGYLTQKSIMDFVDENLPKFSSTKSNSQYSSSEFNAQIYKYTKSSIRKLCIIKYITLAIEILIQILIFMFIKNKFKCKQGGYGRGASYMDEGYYE